MNKINNIQFRIIKQKQFLDLIVSLHKTTFKNVFSGQLGKSFLKYYYTQVFKRGFVIACFNGDEIIGFVSGILDETKLLDFRLVFYLVKAFFMNFFKREFHLNFIRYIKRKLIIKDQKYKTELLSIIIKPEHRGNGFGRKLIIEFDKCLQSQDIKCYKLFTDTNYSTGHFLYDKMDFVLKQEVDLYGLNFRMYIRNL